MARRKQEDPTVIGELQVWTRSVVNLVAWLPWWLGLVLALVFYGGLHYLAIQPRPDVQGLASLYQHAGPLLLRGLATIGQYLLPLLCLGGAWVAFREQRKRTELLQQVTANPAADALDGITWQEFEVLVGEVFRRLGYQVEETGGGGADGGVDLILRRNGEKFLVQCKQWKAFRVSVEVVREMFGLMTAKGADGGFVVTSGRFTKPAHEFAQGRNLSLIDGPALLQWLHQTKAREIFDQRKAQQVPVAQTPPASAPVVPPARRAAAAPPAPTPRPPAPVPWPPCQRQREHLCQSGHQQLRQKMPLAGRLFARSVPSPCCCGWPAKARRPSGAFGVVWTILPARVPGQGRGERALLLKN